MREVVEKFKVYSLKELAKDVRAKVIERERTSKYEHGHYVAEDVNEWVKEELSGLGLPTGDVNWSHSSSQGDGLAFYGSLDWKKQKLIKLTKAQKDALSQAEAKIEILNKRIGYDHYNSMLINLKYDETTNKNYLILKDIEDSLSEEIRDTSKRLFRELTSLYDSHFTDEVIIEDIEANEMEYLENGKTYVSRAA